MGVALVINAISYPIVGSFSDNLRSRLGRRATIPELPGVPPHSIYAGFSEIIENP